MKNKDLIELERQQREASVAAAQAEIQEGEQEPGPDTQPEDNGGNGRMFTQAEVNRIVAERLARERAKGEPTAEEQKAAEMEARESRLKCREYMLAHYTKDPRMIDTLFELFNPENYDEFVQKMETVESFNSLCVNPPPEKLTGDSIFRKIFGLTRKDG